MTDKVQVIVENKVVIPPAQKNFVPNGYYGDLKKIMEFRKFFPIYLSGPSGVGKTSFVKQCCHELNYPMVRVNLTENTTEDHLFGGFRLYKGETVYYKGPVIQAMEAGAVLLLDEGDQAPPTVNMSLQAILEGDSYLIKQTGEFIIPKPGFNVILAANTKGRGDDSGAFIGAQIQNEANLDRYNITFDHQYPDEKVEIKILNNEFTINGLDHKTEFHTNLIKTLVGWANTIRKSSRENISTEVMSTRRLIHYVATFAIFSDKSKTLDLVLSRFDNNTRISWKDLFFKHDFLPSYVNTEADYAKWKVKQKEQEEANKLNEGKNKDWENEFFTVKNSKAQSPF